eukprot:TRINITY_DN49929_c0_g2_i6.p2 TRINITY_DN49929_c0_g2~~TRINITY_DN49929_c0_g2_i6.p2  ORF type:complete len:126 (-),score=17.52 TRINITY_DN49929_c0_g2_i6:393-770(-)
MKQLSIQLVCSYLVGGKECLSDIEYFTKLFYQCPKILSPGGNQDTRQTMKPEAKERLSRIGLVKPEKARRIEDMIINMAKMGRLADKISEQSLIQMLEQVNEKTESAMKVTIQRRRQIEDDEDDW